MAFYFSGKWIDWPTYLCHFTAAVGFVFSNADMVPTPEINLNCWIHEFHVPIS